MSHPQTHHEVLGSGTVADDVGTYGGQAGDLDDGIHRAMITQYLLAQVTKAMKTKECL